MSCRFLETVSIYSHVFKQKQEMWDTSHRKLQDVLTTKRVRWESSRFVIHFLNLRVIFISERWCIRSLTSDQRRAWSVKIEEMGGWFPFLVDCWEHDSRIDLHTKTFFYFEVCITFLCIKKNNMYFLWPVRGCLIIPLFILFIWVSLKHSHLNTRRTSSSLLFQVLQSLSFKSTQSYVFPFKFSFKLYLLVFLLPAKDYLPKNCRCFGLPWVSLCHSFSLPSSFVLIVFQCWCFSVGFTRFTLQDQDCQIPDRESFTAKVNDFIAVFKFSRMSLV